MESEDRNAANDPAGHPADNYVDIFPALPPILQEIHNTPDDAPFETDYAYMRHVFSVLLSFAMAKSLNVQIVSCILGNTKNLVSFSVPGAVNSPTMHEQLISLHDMLERKRNSRLEAFV